MTMVLILLSHNSIALAEWDCIFPEAMAPGLLATVQMDQRSSSTS
jgi:hypothetical protein